jgi:hypothetical protein
VVWVLSDLEVLRVRRFGSDLGAFVELELKLEPRPKINEPSPGSLGSPKLGSFTPLHEPHLA